MRASFDLRITLTESESTGIAVAAYYAQLPVTEWVKQRLLEHTALPTTTTNIAAQPAAALQQMPAAAAEPPPPPQVTAVAAVAAESPPPEPPVTEAPEPSSQPVSKRKRKSPIRSVDKAGVPRGFYAIMEKAEKIHAGRMQIAGEAGSARGRAYVVKMSKWYKEAGLDILDNTTRSELVRIGRNSAAIREWHSKRPGSAPNDIVPSVLYSRWLRDGGTPIEVESPRYRTDSAETPEEPPPAEEPSPPNDETIVFSVTGIRKSSLSEITGGGAAEPVEDHVAEIPPASPTRYDNFGIVDFGKLAPYDARQLRRFTERIVNLGGADMTLEEEKIALAIRKIRGNESGDTPPVVHALARMGVIAAPTVHKLRREYCDRFSDVRKWAEV